MSGKAIKRIKAFDTATHLALTDFEPNNQIERIRRSFADESYTLSEVDEAKKLRLIAISKLIDEYGDNIPVLTNAIKEKVKDVSDRQIRTWRKEAEMVFGLDKNYGTQAEIYYEVDQLNKLYDKAITYYNDTYCAKTLGECVKIRKQINDLKEKLGGGGGLKEIFEKLQMQPFVPVSDPKVLESNNFEDAEEIE